MYSDAGPKSKRSRKALGIQILSGVQDDKLGASVFGEGITPTNISPYFKQK
jgi:hypothetical protein